MTKKEVAEAMVAVRVDVMAECPTRDAETVRAWLYDLATRLSLESEYVDAIMAYRPKAAVR